MTTSSADTATLPVVAPARTDALARTATPWAGAIFFLAFSAPGWAAAFGAPFVGAVGLLATVGTVALAAATVRAPRWSTLPWSALAFTGWAGVSVVWSLWPQTSLLTWALLAATTLLGLSLAAMLRWRELLDALAGALASVVLLSLALELWAAAIVGGPVGVAFAPVDSQSDRSDVWIGGQLLTGGRIDGVVGNANLLSMLSLLAVVVLSIHLAVGPRRSAFFVASLIVAGYLLVRTSSATAFVATAALAVALGVIAMARAVRSARARVILYLAVAAGILVAGVVAWSLRDALLGFLGRERDLTDRTEIWDLVFQRGADHPVVGSGFATPWIPWDPAFSDWIILPRGLHIIQAHSVWVDVWFQLGLVGVVILALVYALFVWRTWVFAVRVHRPHQRQDRFTATVSLLPVALGVIVVIQGLTESSPLLLWGWMLTVLFSAKLQPRLPARHTGSAKTGEVGYGVGLDQPPLV